MEFGFLFKLALGFWSAGALGWLITKYEMKDQHTASIIAISAGVLGIVCMIFGVNLNPDARDYYWSYNDARIADGLCIAQETVKRSPGKSSGGADLPAKFQTRYLCAETEFWRDTK